jgi:hypothetical protein
MEPHTQKALKIKIMHTHQKQTKTLSHSSTHALTAAWYGAILQRMHWYGAILQSN